MFSPQIQGYHRFAGNQICGSSESAGKTLRSWSQCANWGVEALRDRRPPAPWRPEPTREAGFSAFRLENAPLQRSQTTSHTSKGSLARLSSDDETVLVFRFCSG